MRKLISRLQLSFRVLYGQFLLRVIDLEALSIEADIPRFLGQFAGVLIMISLLQAVGALLGSTQESGKVAILSHFLKNEWRHYTGQYERGRLDRNLGLAGVQGIPA
jgi:hypothetical protein